MGHLLTTVGGEPITANFIAFPSSGNAPLTVSFTDQSIGSLTSWLWNFGDGGTSTDQNPTHTYNTPGTYTVSLRVSNAYGSDTETKDNFIQVNPGPSGVYRYYLPYITTNEFYTTWLGLSNCSTTREANVAITFYDENGNITGTQNKVISPDGQEAFPVAPDSNLSPGWMLINSDQPLSGLCFYIALGAEKNYVTTANLVESPSTNLLLPHISQNDLWDTSLIICNPNSMDTNVTLNYVSMEGVSSQMRDYIIPAMGAMKIELSEFMGTPLINSGKVKVSATQGIVAFAVYTFHSFYSGMAHVSISPLQPPFQTGPIEERTGTLTGLVKDAVTGLGIEKALVTVIPGNFSAETEVVSLPFGTIRGRYKIEDIPVGTYTVTASKIGYRSNSRSNVVISADETTTVNITLTPE